MFNKKLMIMEKTAFGFIGGGRITRIFLQAFSNKNVELVNTVVYDTSNEILEKLKKQFRDIEIKDSPDSVFKQKIVFIAVHPPVIMETLEKMKPFLTGETVVVSLAPKITVEKISGKLNTRNIIRMIPNATSIINEGYNPVCFAPGFKEDKVKLTELFKSLGNTFEVAEEKLEAYAIISAMLPTYFWFQLKTVADLGTGMGLDKSEANKAVYETLIASLNTMFKSGLNSEEVIDLIPVKPIGEYEEYISGLLKEKLLTLFDKIKP